jgi:hypothetical protein
MTKTLRLYFELFGKALLSVSVIDIAYCLP